MLPWLPVPNRLQFEGGGFYFILILAIPMENAQFEAEFCDLVDV